MILAISVRKLGVMVGFIMLTAGLLCAVGLRIGVTEEENMSREDLQITVSMTAMSITVGRRHS